MDYSNPPALPQLGPTDHLGHLEYCLTLAKLSPPKPTNYRVGALLLSPSTNTLLSTGYTLELPGNTHAEQVCFSKLCTEHQKTLETLADVLPGDTVLYTTVEPCAKRLSGNMTCVERILKINSKGEGIKKIYVGVREPEKFVGENFGRKMLEDAGIQVILVEGLETAILEVAEAGHEKNAA